MNIAVVGASNNKDTYGYRIVNKLLNDAHTVFPVNLREKEIQGLKAYKCLADIKDHIDIVDIVVPPASTLSIVRQAEDLGVRNIWVQPGAEDEMVTSFLEEHIINFDTVVCGEGDCIMHDLAHYFKDA